MTLHDPPGRPQLVSPEKLTNTQLLALAKDFGKRGNTLLTYATACAVELLMRAISDHTESNDARVKLEDISTEQRKLFGIADFLRPSEAD